jgi:hypothetical protein
MESISLLNMSRPAGRSAGGSGSTIASHSIKVAARSLPFASGAFACAYMLHVGMNIDNKVKLCSEIARVLRSGAVSGINDVMKTGEGELTFPVPWATTAQSSAVAEPAQYRSALEASGFAPNSTAATSRSHFLTSCKDHGGRRSARTRLHVLMGGNAPDKIWNMIANIPTGPIAPVEMIARKA